MSAISDERGEFEDFVRGGDIWSKWDAARRLMASRQMQSAANREGFAESFRDLGILATSRSDIEQLLAIALIVRISDLVKGDLRKEASEILSNALRVPIEGFWTIGEAKNLPLVSKASEIRENIASALSFATGPWVIPYVVDALAREEKSASVVRKLTSAVRLRARLGQKSESLVLRLRQALGAGGSTDKVLLQIADTESGLVPDIDDWLRGRERENSATAAAISSLLSGTIAPSVVESVAALLLEFVEAESNTLNEPDQGLQSYLRRVHARILNLASELKRQSDNFFWLLMQAPVPLTLLCFKRSPQLGK